MAAPGFEYFTSADVGAPSLYGAAGRMIAVLDWVLVTKGGWAKAFSGTNLAAYRSATGNRFYLRVDDTQTQLARLRGYRAMTAISTGTNLFPATTPVPTATWGIGKSDEDSTAVRRYWGIRTNRYVLLVVEYGLPVTGTGYRQVFAFGDVPTLCEVDSFNTVLMGVDSPAGQYFPYSYLGSAVNLGTFTSVASGAHMAASPSGAVNAPGTLVRTAWDPIGMTYSIADVAHTKSGRLQLSPLTLYSNESVSGGYGAGIARAMLPNVHSIAGAIPRTGIADGELITVGSRTYKVLTGFAYDPSSDGGAGAACGGFVLETTDTDGAL